MDFASVFRNKLKIIKDTFITALLLQLKCFLFEQKLQMFVCILALREIEIL